MIRTEQIGPVKSFRLARTIFNRGLYYTACYFVDGLMIDSGCAYTVGELVSALGDRRVSQVVNTHGHEDHIAANAAIRRAFGAEILCHSEALSHLAAPHQRRLRPYQLVMWGYPEASEARPVGLRIETDHHRFDVIHTPGHSPDHVCLYEPDEGWLFCGDAYVGGRDKALRADYNIWLIIESLKKLAALKPLVLFPGSGNTRKQAWKELLEKIGYLEKTGDRVLELHRRGWNRDRIRKKLFGPEMPIAYFTLGHFSGRNLIRSYIEDRESISLKGRNQQ